MSSEKRRSPPQELTPNRQGVAETAASSLLAGLFGRVTRHVTEWLRLYVDQQAALYEPSQRSRE